METFNWGIIGPGRIAAQFAADLRRLPDARLAAVASRDGARATEFAARFEVARAYDSYEALAGDPGVDAIYVSVPHSHHLACVLLALRQGKAVLCEKPLAVNAAQVAEMACVSAEQGAFCMEALWTRFVPVTCQVLAWIAEGRIGEVRQLAGAWGFRTNVNPANRLFDPSLAGGSLLDMGVYAVGAAAMYLGAEPASVQAAAHLGETGVDEQTGMLLRYANGALALLTCAIRTAGSQPQTISGTSGQIDIWHSRPHDRAVLTAAGAEPLTVEGPADFSYEIEEVQRCVRAGLAASPLWPLSQSLAVARIMDAVRGQIGLRYPMD